MQELKQYHCDAVGCAAVRKEINNWYVIVTDESGIHIYHWNLAPKRAMDDGYHFCGIAHTINFVSKALVPDTTIPDRESTLELRPPLTREGKATDGNER